MQMPCGGRELVMYVLALGMSIVAEMWSTGVTEVGGRGGRCWLDPCCRQFGLNLQTSGKPLEGFKLVK